jgi:hypothetical protein
VTKDEARTVPVGSPFVVFDEGKAVLIVSCGTLVAREPCSLMMHMEMFMRGRAVRLVRGRAIRGTCRSSRTARGVLHCISLVVESCLPARAIGSLMALLI